MQKILLASKRAEDERELNHALEGTVWGVDRVSDLDGAVQALKHVAMPILLLDRDFSGDPWASTLHTLSRARRSSCIILLSPVTDQYLWDEVVKQGGFDVLTRPFRRDQVLSTLIFGATRCRTHWRAS